MKKLIALLIALVITSSCLVSCGDIVSDLTDIGSGNNNADMNNSVVQKVPDEEKNTFERGTSDENGWVSKWIGLKFTPTEEMVMATADEIESMMQIGADAYIKDEFGEQLVDYAKVSCVYEMMASSIKGDNVMVMEEKLPLSNMDVNQYVTSFKSSFDMTIAEDMVFSELSKYTLAGVEFDKLDLTYSMSGVQLSQSYLFKKQEDRMIGIIFTVINEGAFESMASMFSEAK